MKNRVNVMTVVGSNEFYAIDVPENQVKNVADVFAAFLKGKYIDAEVVQLNPEDYLVPEPLNENKVIELIKTTCTEKVIKKD